MCAYFSNAEDETSEAIKQAAKNVSDSGMSNQLSMRTQPNKIAQFRKLFI